MDTVSTVPERRSRSNARTRVRLCLRFAGDQVLTGQEPLQRIVTLAALGALTESTVTCAPFAVNRPLMRTTGNGRMILRVAVSWSTWPWVGTGLGAGAATSKTGAGVATGVGAGVGVGVGVGAGATGGAL